MRVAIDARGVQPKLHGISRHVLSLLLGLSHRESELEFLVFYTNPLARKLVERVGGNYRNRFQWISASSKPGSAFESVEVPWLLRINKADLFHDVGTTGLWTSGVPSVLTVHELSALHFKDVRPTPREVKRTLKRSQLLIAVSQSVAEELEASFDVSRPKIRVIPNALDPWYSEVTTEKEIRAMRERFRLGNGYFLCVTAERPNKNVDFALEAAKTWQGNEDWIFTLPQRGEFSKSRTRYLDVVEDVWLRPLYSASSAVVIPSLYEGFSLPPLEALGTGAVPVISNIPAHRELLKGVLPEDLFFDPVSIESLRSSLRFATDGGESLKNALHERFRTVRDRYSFIETAESVQAVYREALRG